MMQKKPKIRYEGAQPLGVLPYVWAICISLMYTICREQVFVCSVLMCAFATGVYMLVYKLQTSKIGSAAVTTLMTAACFAAIAVVSFSFMDFVAAVELNGDPNDPELRGFAHFLFSASAYFDWAYAMAALLMFAVVIGFICCYFSAVLPRANNLLLPAFIPIILAARTAGKLDLPLMAVIFGTYVCAVCCSSRPCENAGVATFGGMSERRTRLVSALLLGATALTVAFVLPRCENAPMERYLDFMLQKGRGFYNGVTLSNFSSNSSVNTGENDPSDEVIFVAQTRIPCNLDRWSFDVYKGAEGWTYIPSEYNTGYANWRSGAKELSYAALFKELIKGAEDGKLSSYANELTGLEKYGATSADVYIRVLDDQNATAVVMHPVNVYSVQFQESVCEIYRTLKGEMFSAVDVEGAKYVVSYYADKPDAEHSEVVERIGFLDLIGEAYVEDIISYTTYNAFRDDYSNAREYYELTGFDGISTDMYELAQEITAGCTSDYEKYRAIEKWFGENGFLYDLDFVPQSAEADYFVFESKRGICSDFATAATLLARAAGLPARYTEGFALTEDCRDENGVYNVTAAQAHAYTQVYVDGCGWLNLDATKYVEAADNNGAEKALLVILLILLALIVIAALAFVFRKRLGVLWFMMTYRMRAKPSRIRAVYMQTRAIACELSDSNEEITTCGETCSVITNMLSMPSEAKAICDAADKLMYSHELPDADTAELYRCFRRICKRRRVLKR